MASTHEYKSFGSDVKKTHESTIVIGVIGSIDVVNNTADIDINGVVFTGVPIFYHCPDNPNVGAGYSAFSIGDNVLVLIEDGLHTIIGFSSGRKMCDRAYLIIRVDWRSFDKVLIWDFTTNSVATDWPDPDHPGSFLSFPCDFDKIDDSWLQSNKIKFENFNHTSTEQFPCVPCYGITSNYDGSMTPYGYPDAGVTTRIHIQGLNNPKLSSDNVIDRGDTCPHSCAYGFSHEDCTNKYEKQEVEDELPPATPTPNPGNTTAFHETTVAGSKMTVCADGDFNIYYPDEINCVGREYYPAVSGTSMFGYVGTDQGYGDYQSWNFELDREYEWTDAMELEEGDWFDCEPWPAPTWEKRTIHHTDKTANKWVTPLGTMSYFEWDFNYTQYTYKSVSAIRDGYEEFTGTINLLSVPSTFSKDDVQINLLDYGSGSDEWSYSPQRTFAQHRYYKHVMWQIFYRGIKRKQNEEWSIRWNTVDNLWEWYKSQDGTYTYEYTIYAAANFYDDLAVTHNPKNQTRNQVFENAIAELFIEVANADFLQNGTTNEFPFNFYPETYIVTSLPTD